MTDVSKKRERYRAGDLLIDAGMRRVSRDSLRIRLPGLSFDLLLELIRAAPEVVSVDRLMDLVWPGRVVNPETVGKRVTLLRDALGDDIHDPRYIAVERGRGYRWLTPVTTIRDETEAQPASAARAGRWRIWAVTGVLAVLLLYMVNLRIELPGEATGGAGSAVDDFQAHSLAVLPFADMSPAGDQEYFADGLAEEIIHLLAQIESLKVIGRTSSFSFKDKGVAIPQIGKTLGVDHILEGSVRKAGDQLRITAQLVNAEDGSHLWSETYDRQLSDIFAIQNEIAVEVAGALELNLHEGAARLSAYRPDPEAHALNLQAWFLFNRREPGDLEDAGAYYRRALDVDPEYAAPWTGLAGVYYVQAMHGDRDFAEGLARAREAAERAVELDPTLPEARARLGRILEWLGERDAAALHMEKAVEYGQNSPLVLNMQAGYAWLEGRHSEAIELNRRASALDPLNVTIRENLANNYLSAGRLDEAEREIHAALDISTETGRWGPLNHVLMDILVLQRKPAKALSLIADWPEGRARDRALALIHAIDGQTELFDAAVARLAAAADFGTAVALAEAFALRGDVDSAFEWLDTARELIQPADRAALARNWAGKAKVLTSPFFEAMRSDPRWQGWLRDPRKELAPSPDG